jgi:hypothetical protein
MKVCEKCKNVHDSSFGTGRFCSRKCANSRVWSDEDKKKKSNTLKGSVPWNAGTRRIYVKKCVTCKKEFTVEGWSKKKTCSTECMSHAPGRNGGYRSNSTRKIRSEYKGYWMDSGAELKFAELLDKHDIRWVKNSERFFTYRDLSGKLRKYYPDFYLPEYDYWVEIKGTYYKHENDNLKLKSVGSNIELQYHNEIKLPKCIT